MKYPFWAAMPAINKYLSKPRFNSSQKKLDFLYYLKKENENMILEFKRIFPEWMYKISEEGFSSRNKHLDHIIIFGKRET